MKQGTCAKVAMLGLMLLGLGAAPAPEDPASLDLDATLPASLATGSFRMKVTVDEVPAALLTNAANDPEDPAQQFAARVVVKLGTPPDDGSFTVTEYQPHDELTNDDGTHFYAYYVEVKEAKKGALAAKAPKGELKISVAFYLGGHGKDDLVVEAKDVTIDQEPNLKAATPDTPGALPVAGGLQILWQPKAPVHAANGETYPSEPEKVHIYALSPDLADGTPLPAKRKNYDDDTGDTDATCTLYAGAGQCVFCPDDGDYYLDAKAMAKVDGVKVVTAPTADGLAVVSGLTAGGKYEVFMQYAPKNLNVSQCMFAYPL